MNGTKKVQDEPIIIKKYANRRLYNTATSSYVTLEYLCQMVKSGNVFIVLDAKTKKDITRSVLTQIIVEEEGKGEQNLLPVNFLRQLISYYGDSNQENLLPEYLDMTMRSFALNKDKMQGYMHETFGHVFPFDKIDDMNKQNTAIFEQAMQLFTPFAQNISNKTDGQPVSDDENSPNNDDLQSLKQQLDSLQSRLSRMEKD